MNTPYMVLVAAKSDALDNIASAPAFAFVSPTDDGMLEMRYFGPGASGRAVLPADAPLSRVSLLLRDAHGPSEAPLLATFIPTQGSTANTPERVHAEGRYTVLVRRF